MGPATRGTRGKWYIPSTGAPSKRLYEEVVPNDLVIVENDDKEFIPRIQEAPKDPYKLLFCRSPHIKPYYFLGAPLLIIQLGSAYK